MLITAWFRPADEEGFGPGHLRRCELSALPRVGDSIESAQINPMFWSARDCQLSFEDLNLYLLVDVPVVFADSAWVVTAVEWLDLTEPRVEISVLPQEMIAAPGKPVWAFLYEHRLESEAGPADSEFGEQP